MIASEERLNREREGCVPVVTVRVMKDIVFVSGVGNRFQMVVREAMKPHRSE